MLCEVAGFRFLELTAVSETCGFLSTLRMLQHSKC
jgi:hypothetical protein